MLKDALICALHGFSTGAESFNDLALPDLWAPSLSGHGPTPTMYARCFEDEVRRLISAIEERSAGVPVQLLGYSMGARLAIGLLTEAPHLFSSALLIGANPGLESNEQREERRRWEREWEALLIQEGIDVFVTRWQKQAIFATQKALPAQVLETQQRKRKRHTAAGLAYAMRVLGLGNMPNYWPRLSQLQIPVRWIVGSADDKFLTIARRATQLNASFDLVELPEVGHNPLLESPQEVRRLILSGRSA